jgi:hypothetical protein
LTGSAHQVKGRERRAPGAPLDRPPDARPDDGLAGDFVVESDRAQLSEIVQRVRDGRLQTNVGKVATLDDAGRWGAQWHSEPWSPTVSA